MLALALSALAVLPAANALVRENGVVRTIFPITLS